MCARCPLSKLLPLSYPLLVRLAAAAGKVYANSKRLYAGKQTAGLAEWLGWLAR